MVNRQSTNTKAFVFWFCCIFTSLLLATFAVNSTSLLIGSSTIYWPALLGQITAIGSTLLVVSIVQHADNKSDVQSNDVAVALFTFANSISALAPLLSEVLFFVSRLSLSPQLEMSLIYAALSQTSNPKCITVSVTAFVTGLAIWVCFVSANQIAKRQRVFLFSTFASVFILVLETIWFSEWYSATYRFESEHYWGLTIWLFVLASILSAVLSYSIYGIPNTARVYVALANNEIKMNKKLAYRFACSFTYRFSQIFLSVLFLLLISWEALIPSSLGVFHLLHEHNFVDVILQALVRFGQTFFYLLVALCGLHFFLWIVKYKVESRPIFLRLKWPQSMGHKFSTITRWTIFVAISIIVLWGLGRFLKWLFSLAVIFVVSLLPTKSGPESHDVKFIEWSGPVAHCEPLIASEFIKKEIHFQCDSKYFGMGWEYGSSSDVTSSLHSCSIANAEEMRGGGFYLVVGSSSVENDQFKVRENKRAFDRGIAIAKTLRSQMDRNGIDEDIYILNLGMQTKSQFRVQNRSRYNRPIIAIQFTPFPRGYERNEEATRTALSKFFDEEYGESGHSLCDVYRFAENLEEGAPTWTDLCP